MMVCNHFWQDTNKNWVSLPIVSCKYRGWKCRRCNCTPQGAGIRAMASSIADMDFLLELLLTLDCFSLLRDFLLKFLAWAPPSTMENKKCLFIQAVLLYCLSYSVSRGPLSISSILSLVLHIYKYVSPYPSPILFKWMNKKTILWKQLHWHQCNEAANWCKYEESQKYQEAHCYCWTCFLYYLMAPSQVIWSQSLFL